MSDKKRRLPLVKPFGRYWNNGQYREATITNIKAQLMARGWTTINEEIVEKAYKPEDNCHLELIHEDGTRKGWGMFPRIYCYTEAYEAITGQPWLNSVVKPAPRPF